MQTETAIIEDPTKAALLDVKTEAGVIEDPTKAALLDVKSVAAMLNCSTRHVYRLADAGRIPRPVKLGALVRWSRSAVEQWIVDGCPAVRKGGRP